MKKAWGWYSKYDDLIQMYLWFALIIPTLVWWRDSVLWVAIMSLYANIKTSHGAHKAEMAKRESQKEAE